MILVTCTIASLEAQKGAKKYRKGRIAARQPQLTPRFPERILDPSSKSGKHRTNLISISASSSNPQKKAEYVRLKYLFNSCICKDSGAEMRRLKKNA